MSEKRKNPPVEHTVWMSLEEVAGCLGETQWTVLRWAKEGDPRLPGYKVWDENAGNQGRFRFKKQDVDALLVAGVAEGPAPVASAAAPVARQSRAKRASTAS